MDIFKCVLQHFVGDFARLLYGAVHKLFIVRSRIHWSPQNKMSDARPHGFFNVPQLLTFVRQDLRIVVLIRADLKV